MFPHKLGIVYKQIPRDLTSPLIYADPSFFLKVDNLLSEFFI